MLFLEELKPTDPQCPSFERRAMVIMDGTCDHLFVDCKQAATIDFEHRHVTLHLPWNATIKYLGYTTEFLKQYWRASAFFSRDFVLGRDTHYQSWTLTYLREG